MIPAGFDYYWPSDLGTAIGLLQGLGDEARVIAGSHSLVPMMKLRMAVLSHLVDLRDIPDLQGIEIGADSASLGAMVTQDELIAHAGLGQAVPLRREAALQIADSQVRYPGTLGGNVANGDPDNDMPGLMQCLDATYQVTGPDDLRQIQARDFYESAYFTARADDEILTRLMVPIPAAGTDYAYEKQKTQDRRLCHRGGGGAGRRGFCLDCHDQPGRCAGVVGRGGRGAGGRRQGGGRQRRARSH